MTLPKLLAATALLAPAVAWGQATAPVTGAVVKNGAVQQATTAGTLVPFPVATTGQPGVTQYGTAAGTACQNTATCNLGPTTFTSSAAQGPEINLTGYGSNPPVADFYHATNGEPVFQVNLGGLNTLILENLNGGGYSTMVARQVDLQYPSTAQNSTGSYEHMAIGYGDALSVEGFNGFNYWESSRYDGTGNAAIPPSRLILQQTGGQYPGGTQYALASATNGSTSLTFFGGGTWPTGINGYTITSPEVGGYLAPGTSIVSGAGTTTLVLSKAAVITGGPIQVQFGSATYGQCNRVIMQENGPIDFIPYASCGIGSTGVSNPYARFDAANSRVGFGSMGTALPLTTLDVMGNAVIGATTNSRAIYSLGGVLNIDSPGGSADIPMHFYKAGVDQLNLYWNSSPSRFDWYDVNGGITPLSIHLDGSASAITGLTVGAIGLTSTAGPTTLGTTTATSFRPSGGIVSTQAGTAAYTLANSDCGTTVWDTGATAAHTIIIPSGLPIKCDITVTEATGNLITIQNAAGEQVGYFSPSAGTSSTSTTAAGNFSMALGGQWDSRVIEQKTATLAVVSSGQ